jgi:hypothetical protein
LVWWPRASGVNLCASAGPDGGSAARADIVNDVRPLSAPQLPRLT